MTFVNGIKSSIIRHLGNDKYEKIIFYFCIVLIIHFSIKCFYISQTETFSFDGAINAQVSQNLIKNFSYSTRYDGGQVFDPSIQTGIPVIFPLALLFTLFGESFEIGLIINAFYCVSLLIAILYFIKYCLKLPNFYSLIFILFFYSTPQIFIYAFGLFGEIPTLFYIFLVIIFLFRFEVTNQQKYLFLSGLSFGLAYLTKTIAFIVFPSLILFFLLLFLDRKDLKIKFKKVVFAFISGVTPPILLFEIFKFSSFKQIQSYLFWWKNQTIGIFQQAGVISGFQDTNGFLQKFTKHLGILSNEINVHVSIIIIILILISFSMMGLLFITIKKEKKVLRIFPTIVSTKTLIFLFTIALTYFGWWLFITPTQKAWYRRIINGLILVEVSIIIVLFFINAIILKLHRIKKNDNIVKFSSLFLLNLLFLIFLVFTPSKLTNYKISFMDSELKKNTEEASILINTLPPQSQFFGFGWWQAPILSFESNKEFYNLDFDVHMSEPGLKNYKYLIIDSFAKKTAENEYSKIFEEFNYQEMFSNDDYEIYKLLERKFHTYRPFSFEEKKLVDNNFIDFSADPVYGYFRNVYSDEPNGLGKWSKMYSGYLLKYVGENYLSISIWIPELTRYEKENLYLDVYMDNLIESSYQLISDGLHEFTIPIKTKYEDSIEISLFLNGRIKEKVDTRELAFRIISIKLDN